MTARPPMAFGTTWRHAGVHKRYGNEFELWLADEPTQAFSDAYRGAKEAMTTAGFSWTDRGHSRPNLAACWWDLGPVDLCGLANAADRAIREAADARAEKARAAAERLAREVAEVAPIAVPIRAELAAIIEGRPWALGRQIGEARQLLGDDAWERSSLQHAERLISNAHGNIYRANERLEKLPIVEWWARAKDPLVRTAALQACRILSALDCDWAAERNSRGWSQATCWTGHILSEHDVLDDRQAGHALGLLHQHRRQFPDELCILLFGSAPTRRSRPVGPDAPTLAL